MKNKNRFFHKKSIILLKSVLIGGLMEIVLKTVLIGGLTAGVGGCSTDTTTNPGNNCTSCTRTIDISLCGYNSSDQIIGPKTLPGSGSVWGGPSTVGSGVLTYDVSCGVYDEVDLYICNNPNSDCTEFNPSLPAKEFVLDVIVNADNDNACDETITPPSCDLVGQPCTQNCQ